MAVLDCWTDLITGVQLCAPKYSFTFRLLYHPYVNTDLCLVLCKQELYYMHHTSPFQHHTVLDCLYMYRQTAGACCNYYLLKPYRQCPHQTPWSQC